MEDIPRAELAPPPSIAERLAAWNRTGDPAALWPHVSRAACDAAQQTLVRAAAAALSGGVPPRLSAASSEELAALGVMAFRSGMGPLAGWWLQAGMLEAHGQARDLLERHLSSCRQRATVLDGALRRVLETLTAAGVSATLLKGAHTSRVYFPAPGTRPAGDLDVLVEPAAFETAAAALRGAGFQEVRRTRRPPRSEWVDPRHPAVVRSLEMEHPENPWMIDLHRSLERHYFRGVRAVFQPDLWRLTQLEGAGWKSQALAQPLLVAFLALHASYRITTIRLLPVVELVLVIRRDAASGALVWDELAALLRATGTERFVYPALDLAQRLAPRTLPDELMARLAAAATARCRRMVDQVWALGVQPVSRSVEEWAIWPRGPLELLSSLGDFLWPSDDGFTLREVARLYLRRWRMVRARRVSWRKL